MIVLKHKQSAPVKKCVTGFSLTTFFFGLLVPLVRGDLKWAAIIFALGLMERGFVPADVSSKNWCVANGLLGATA